MNKIKAWGASGALMAALMIFAAYPAVAQNTTRSLEEEVLSNLGQNGSFDMGLFGETRVKLEEESLVNSYSSDPSITDHTVTIGSNLSVEIDNNAELYGNIAVPLPEPEGVTVSPAATVTGEVQYNQQEWELQPIDMPAWYTIGGGDPEGVILGDVGTNPGKYNIDNTTKKFTAYNNAIVTFTPGIYHFEHFELKQNVKFNIGIGSEEIIEIYIGSSMKFENNTGFELPIEVVGDATRLRVYYNGTSPADLSNNVKFTGLLYAPNATILAKNNQNIYGAVVGKEIDLKQNAGVHYDAALAGSFDFIKPKIKIAREIWEEVVLTE